MRDAIRVFITGLFLAGLVVAGTVALYVTRDPKQKEITVAVAASAYPAVAEFTRGFERRHPNADVLLSQGATGNLAHQLREGAPYDVFLSADTETPQSLAEEGVLAKKTVRPYAQAILVLWQAREVAPPVSSLQDLAREDIHRVAIANPEHAPYGKAAREALRQEGIWEKLKPKIIYGNNVRQAYEFISTGNADAGLLALSMVVTEEATPHWVHEMEHQASLGIHRDSVNDPIVVQFVEEWMDPDMGGKSRVKYGLELEKSEQ